jgi:hypothetical protein
MPLYRGTIYKHIVGGEAWSNVYTIQESNALEAVDVLNAIELAEKAVSYSGVHFIKGHVVNLADSTDTRTSNYTDEPGDLDPAGLGGPLPLFCTVRVTFSNESGKPEQKYLRLLANESNLTLGVWDSEFVAFIDANYAVPLLEQTQYVGPSGEAHLLGIVHQEVQNRQLGWHRRSRPGFKRGWVAV